MSNEQANEYLRWMRSEAQKSRDGEPVDPEVEPTALFVDEIFTKMETGMVEIAERYLPELREAGERDVHR